MVARFQDNRDQKDLFGHLETRDKKTTIKRGFFLSRIKKSITLSYENIIFLAIAFIMLSIIFFSLGVEKGRQDVNGDYSVETIGPRVKELEESRDNSKKATGQQDKYLIQLAAFRKRKSAEEEQARLNKEGYSADIKKSGFYYQLYISGIKNKETAQRLLEDLKKKYKDSYIKTL